MAGQEVHCSKCNQLVQGKKFSKHLSDHHTEEMCDTCEAKLQDTVGLLNHIQLAHDSVFIIIAPSPQRPTLPPPKPTSSPSLLPSSVSSAQHTATPLEPSSINWKGFLPEQFREAIQESDQEWIAKCLYEPTGQLKQKIKECWFHPPLEPKPSPPEPGWYFRKRMFIWAPITMWGVPLKCPQCSWEMNSSGLYRMVREVIDMDSRYYLVGGDYPCCSKCSQLICPWSQDMLSQLDVADRSRFPAVLTTQLALDRKFISFLRPRTNGYSSSDLQSAVEELHSDEWVRQAICYLADCEHHMKMATCVPSGVVYLPPPPFRPLPPAQWFEAVLSNDILSHLDEMMGVIASTYGTPPPLLRGCIFLGREDCAINVGDGCVYACPFFHLCVYTGYRGAHCCGLPVGPDQQR